MKKAIECFKNGEIIEYTRNKCSTNPKMLKKITTKLDDYASKNIEIQVERGKELIAELFIRDETIKTLSKIIEDQDSKINILQQKIDTKQNKNNIKSGQRYANLDNNSASEYNGSSNDSLEEDINNVLKDFKKLLTKTS